jgi:histidine triad (HIT) family protein
MDCIFCKIAQEELPSTKVYEDDEILAFKDINPVAPVHILVIPKKHIASLATIEAEDAGMLSRMMLIIRDIATEQGLDENGYRVLSNHGPDSGQLVDHLHFHILGGRKLGSIG